MRVKSGNRFVPLVDLGTLISGQTFRESAEATDFTSPDRIFMVVYSAEDVLNFGKTSMYVYAASLETGHVARFSAADRVEVVDGAFHYLS